jgi:hypothetical protein
MEVNVKQKEKEMLTKTNKVLRMSFLLCDLSEHINAFIIFPFFNSLHYNAAALFPLPILLMQL